VNSEFKDHFSKTSADYATYRPTYPMRLADELAKISPAQNLALDVGCGTGQLSILLAERFNHVIATDASAAQIAKATPHENVTYRTALAESSGMENSSVDLITVAQAAHWLDLEKFYTEVRHITKPNAAIALITYGVLHVEDESIDAIIQEFYWKTIGAYWPPERRHVEEGYRNLPFPFHETKFPNLAIEVDWRLEYLIGYIKTWSALSAAQKALATDPVAQFESTLRKQWSNPELRRHITWPLSLRVGSV
jgi:SAM-dependent methyltransferase